ncbi:putative Isotrichodermin C-15 hydroxylase [Glarea lozoyensis 74030]|uniref:Putative Isotrichodermin C-15 hydroxylase n=1 Tax=Glarea lozoyensis (strain ATCC 74030 / MF5533) TaxID=1104152 RepID=H0EGI3_GLAL7|nr:putative Isotrichodermin C-15 hydroxylase [Glarea lozoyensis 74030]
MGQNLLAFLGGFMFLIVVTSREALPKSKLWHSPAPGRPKSILNALDPKDHQRFRRSIEPGLSEKALREQEDIMQTYVSSMIAKLEKTVSSKGGADVVDISSNAGCFVALLPWLELANEPSHSKECYALNLEMTRPDILSYIKIDDKGVNGLTLPEVQATSSIIIIAGSETTVSILSGITNYLVRNPAKLDLLTTDIRKAFASFEDIKLLKLRDLRYLNAVIQEGFRLCNPTPVGLPRIVPSNGVRIAGQYIPGNTFVNVHPLAISLSGKLFAKPDEFIPERWLDSALKDELSPFHDDHRGAVQVFSVGPRSCPGKHLALAEIRLMLSKLIWKFDLAVADTPRGKLHWNEQRVFSVVERQPFEILIKTREI